MLNRIKLTNFQRHRTLEVTFNGGISALRGTNEAGKSTLIRAICYALFGSKAMPVSLDELVTWGESAASLKVELDVRLDNVVYSIKRGKSGAEVTYDGGIVTGQNETVAFVSRLLKADAGSAARLMLANQNEIRGALSSGAKATTELIEQLAEFDQIDNLIELMQEKLTLGSTATAEAAITAAQQTLDNAQGGTAAPDNVSLDAAVDAARAALDTADAAAAAGDTRFNDRQAALMALNTAKSARDEADRTVKRETTRVQRAAESLEAATAVAKPQRDAVWLDGQRAEITRLEGLATVRAARAAVEKFLGEPALAADDRFEGAMPALLAEIKSTSNERHGLSTQANNLRACAKMARSRISTGACATCGQDVSHQPGVAERNAALEAEAKRDELEATRHEATERGLAEYLAALEAVRDEAAPRLQALDRFSAYLSADALLPPTLTWTGGDVPEDAAKAVAATKAGIAQAEAEQRAWDAASGRAQALRTELDVATKDLAAAQAAFDAAPAVDTTAAEAALEVERNARAELQRTARDAQRAADAAHTARTDALAAYERALRLVEQARETLVKRRAELKVLNFNNALLKAVRAARPLIADKLWNLVLSAVSRYFSEMRGTKSRVTKESDGFRVDGHTATTLSGSTLDILGLAIRVALTRTFLPTAPFLVLDEPAAAMDGDRTSLMLGFLVSCGFPQTLLVTHEDISETVADNIIHL